MTGCVLLHAYEWDDYIQRRADALARRSGGLDFYVLADETRGPVNVPSSYRKLAHTVETFREMGLPITPDTDRALWWNMDYALYHALTALPTYDYYVRLDADVHVTRDLIDAVDHMRAKGLDWLTLPPRQVTGWSFRPSMHGLSYQDLCYVPVMALFLSRRAVVKLRKDRVAHAMAWTPDQAWAFCEGFIASALMSDMSIAVGGIDDVMDTSLFKAELALLEGSSRLMLKDRIFHAVLDDRRFAAKLKRSVRHTLHMKDVRELAELGFAAETAECLPTYFEALRVPA